MGENSFGGRHQFDVRTNCGDGGTVIEADED
jgi:hypothetical protein